MRRVIRRKAIRKLSIWIGALGLGASLPWAASASELKSKAKLPNQLLQSLATFRARQGGQVELKKTSQNHLIGKESQSNGHLYFKLGKFRIDFEKPEPSTLIMDGKVIWYEVKFGADSGGKTIVNKIRAKSLNKSQSLWTAILNDGEALDSFQLIEKTSAADLATFRLKPKHESEIQELKVVTTQKDKRVIEIAYTDDRENEVRFELGAIQALKKETQFKYTPPSGAEVTEF